MLNEVDAGEAAAYTELPESLAFTTHRPTPTVVIAPEFTFTEQTLGDVVEY